MTSTADKRTILALKREQLRRLIQRDPRAALAAFLFGPQRRFFEDKSESKIALCSRRAGKSHTCAVELIVAALTHPKSVATYLALTRQSAKEIMWATLLQMLDLYQIDYTKHENELTITLSNYSNIRLLGADHKRVIETLRGPRRCIVVIDEFGSFSPLLQTLVEDSIEPSLIDLQGRVVFVGTPPPARTEYFSTLIQRHQLHHWTLLDNPHIQHAREWLEKQKLRKGWTDNNPTYRREYLGEIVDDPDALVYKLQPWSVADALPSAPWEYGLGIDYGWHDSCAISVIAWTESHPNAYIVESVGFSHMIPATFAAVIQQYKDRYKTELLVADTGGLGKAITEEFRQRYHLPIQSADKTEKNATINLLNGDLIDKRLFILRTCTKLIEQMKYLQWDDRQREKAGMPNDLCDSALYIYRKSRHYWHEDAPVPPKYGTDEWMKLEEERMLSNILDAYNKEQAEELTHGWN